MKTLVYSTHQFEKSFLQQASLNIQELVYTDELLNLNSANHTKGFNAISLFTSDNAMGDVLKIIYANGIRFIALRSVGHDNVDLSVAKELGIKVANVPSYSPNAVAEQAVTLLMALNRKIILGQKRMNENNFCLDGLVGFDLFGKTIGMVGTGKIGAAFATIMKGFGCKLLGYDIVQNAELIQQTGIVYTTLDELCNQSDVISIHCPLTSVTHHLFNKRLFCKMKKDVFLINTARGGIINTLDLIDALTNKTIAGAGLDVYENEKPIFFTNHLDNSIQDTVFKKLQSFPNVLITGHQAFLTNEALSGIAEATLKNLTEFSEKGFSKNDVN
jgi:D-lactate dehydrogenase